MDNKNLPQTIKENIFTKFKKWIKSLFFKHNNEAINPNIKTNPVNKTNFIDKINIEDKTKILNLQKQLKQNNIKVSELTDSQLNQIIELYKKQIKQKKLKLKQYRKIIKRQ